MTPVHFYSFDFPFVPKCCIIIINNVINSNPKVYIVEIFIFLFIFIYFFISTFDIPIDT